MKYVFVINSHTTFLTSLGVINYLKLAQTQVLLIYVRNYSNTIINVPFSVEDFSELYNSCRHLFDNIKIRTHIVYDIDKAISSKINDDYELFIPHLANGLFQILYTNSHCKKVSYIQEGGIPFKTAYKTKVTFIEKIIYSLYNTLYLRTNRVWKPFRWYVKGYVNTCELDSYAISNTFFKYLPSHNHIIKWPQVSVPIVIEPCSTIFIFDGFVQHKFIERDFYLKLCKKLVTEYHDKTNYIRFHPAQEKEDRNRILSFFIEQDLHYEIMDEKIPFELILLSNLNLKVVGFGSSLLFFAQDFGHKVFCMDYWLNQSKLYQQYKRKSGFEWFSQVFKQI